MGLLAGPWGNQQMTTQQFLAPGPVRSGTSDEVWPSLGVPLGVPGWYVRHGKRVLDVAGSFILLLILAVPLAGVLVTMLILQGRPLFFRSLRTGRNGRTFEIIKLRSMDIDAEKKLVSLLEEKEERRREFDRYFKLAGDSRVTPLGRLLRKYSVDEVPQFFNVLAGHMSLVGPRPVTPFERTKFYGENGLLVNSVRPGITGLWQVRGRSKLAYPVRVQLDIEYVKTCGLLTDLSILMRTVPAVMRARGAA